MTGRTSATLPVAPVESVAVGNAVLTVAEQSGILAELAGSGSRTAGQVADGLGLDERATQVLLDALVEVEIVERQGFGYRAHPGLSRIVRAMGTVADALGRRVRTGEPALSGDRPEEAGPLYEGLVGMLGTFFSEVAQEAAELLAAPRLQILDAGAGTAPWSRAIVRREPTCTVDALDLPQVLPATRKAVADAGFEQRFRYLEADVLDDELAADRYDLVLAANLCHLFDPPTAERVIGKLASATRRGGSVAIVDAVPDHDDPDRRRYVALYAAGLLTRTASGRVHTFDDYRRWLRDAGACNIVRHDCTRFPTSVIVAQVPDPSAD